MREFITSAKNAESAQLGGPTVDLKIDGREIKFNAPDANQLVMMTAAIESSANTGVLAAAMINSFFSLIDDQQDASHLRARLFDPRDPFGLETIGEVMASLVEEWSDRPTQGTSVSSSPPPTHGSTSKARPSGSAFHRGPSPSHSGAPSLSAGSGAESRKTQTD
jgi:hypothetical protein